MLNEVLIIEKPTIKKEKIHSFDISGMVTISGDVNGIISISIPKSIALRIGSVILGEQIKIVGTELTDSIVNLINIIVGHAKHFINSKIQFSIPYVVVGKDRPIGIDPSIPLIIIPFKCGQGELALEIAIKNNITKKIKSESLSNTFVKSSSADVILPCYSCF